MTPLRRILTVAVIGAVTSMGLIAPSVADAPKTYHQSSSGDTVKVAKGTRIRISLVTASDGGYGWVVTRGKHSDHFKILSRRVVSPPQTGGTPTVGGYTHTVYTLLATERGTGTFKAVERRSFGDTTPIKRFTLYLRVTKP